MVEDRRNAFGILMCTRYALAQGHEIARLRLALVTLCIKTPLFLTINYLKFEQVQFTTECCV